MRLLRSHNIPSYLSTFEEISPKYASTKFFSLMHLPETPPEFMSFEDWTQNRQSKRVEPPPQPHIDPSQEEEQHREATPPPPAPFDYPGQEEIVETRMDTNPNESIRNLTLRNQQILSQNQKILAKRIDNFEMSFTTRLATVEESLSTVLTVLKEVLQRVRGPTPPSDDWPTPVSSPPAKHSKLSEDEPLKEALTSPSKASTSGKIEPKEDDPKQASLKQL